jgi:hypothetical protein
MMIDSCAVYLPIWSSFLHFDFPDCEGREIVSSFFFGPSSLSLSLRCALSNYKAQGFFFCLFMESTLFKMSLSSLVVGTLSTLSDEMKKGARTYIISYRYIIFVFWGQYRPPRAVHCSTHTHTRAERTQWKWSGFVGHSTGILYQLLHTHTY